MVDLKIGQYWVLPASGELPPLLVGVFSLDETEKQGLVAGVLIQPHPTARKAGWPQVPHVPICAGALDLETGRLVRDDEPIPPQFTDGYDLWKQKFEADQAGVFSISVMEAYAGIVNIMKDTSTKNG